jgi:predicted Rossmann-fold nucleotide-binding protein
MSTQLTRQPPDEAIPARESLPDGSRVLVAGGHDISEDPVRDFCTELGRALISRAPAETPVVLITGGRDDERAADRAVVEGARAALAENRGDIRTRVVTFLPPNKSTTGGPFDGTFERAPRSGTRQARRFAMTAAADIVVCVDGGHGTAEQAILAMALGRPCLPLPFTGCKALEIWNHEEDGSDIRQTFGITQATADRWEADFRAAGDVKALVAEVADLVVDKAALPCFISMPYDARRAAEVYDKVIEPAIRRAGMRAVVSKESRRPGPISDDMLDDITRASVVCAFLTDERYTYARPGGDRQPAGSVNPNVMYEAGFARALDKPTVLLADDVEAVPFNLRCHRFIGVREDLAAAREKLADMLADIRGRRPQP